MLTLLKLTHKYQTHAPIIERVTINKERVFLVIVWDDLARAPQLTLSSPKGKDNGSNKRHLAHVAFNAAQVSYNSNYRKTNKELNRVLLWDNISVICLHYTAIVLFLLKDFKKPNLKSRSYCRRKKKSLIFISNTAKQLWCWELISEILYTHLSKQFQAFIAQFLISFLCVPT